MGLYDRTLGTLLVGVFFNTFLYGLVMYQFAAYYRTKFNDRPAIKYMVLFLFVLDTFHSASAIYMAWNYAVTNYDNPVALAVAEWPYTFTPLATALAAFITQIYLGIRIWRFTDSKILYGVVILLAIPSCILGIACSIEAWIIEVVSELPRITPLVISWWTMQITVDMFITVTLVIVFFRSRTGFGRTDTVLNRLIRGAIQTGLFAGIFSWGDLFCFVLLPGTNLHGMFAIPIGRIYTNTVMDTLLTRRLLNAELFATYDVSEGLGTIEWGGIESSQTTSKQQKTSDQLQVEVQRTVEAMYDRDHAERQSRPTGGLR